LADYHKVQIEFLQHERLAHLITTLAFAAITMAAYVCSVVFASAVLILVSLVLTVFDVFYIIHYYRLENGIQRWYKIYNSLCKKQNGSGDQA
ncbi:MAG: hypothetical protein HGA22_15020, partial [Clostridiales bacterium]|nr:hypothetical protein [Clostridiales bacterium]